MRPDVDVEAMQAAFPHLQLHARVAAVYYHPGGSLFSYPPSTPLLRVLALCELPPCPLIGCTTYQ